MSITIEFCTETKQTFSHASEDMGQLQIILTKYSIVRYFYQFLIITVSFTVDKELGGGRIFSLWVVRFFMLGFVCCFVFVVYFVEGAFSCAGVPLE